MMEAQSLIQKTKLFYYQHYYVYGISLFGAGISCSLLAGILQLKYTIPAITIATVIMVFLLIMISYLAVCYYLNHLEEKLATIAATAETTRLTARLEPYRQKLRQYAKCEDANLLVIPGNRSAAWTLRSKDSPLVVFTSVLWTQNTGTDTLELILAHEAGHIQAGDVEKFKALSRLTAVILVALGLLLVTGLVITASRIGKPFALSSFMTLISVILLSTLSILAGWSSLLCVRELEADAFAAQTIGNSQRVSDFLAARQTVTLSGSGFYRIIYQYWRQLIQPNLTWRSTLPGLSGEPGKRIDYSMGLSLLGTLLLWCCNMFFLEDLISSTKVDWGFFLFLAGLTVIWLLFQSFKYLWSRFNTVSARSIINRALVIGRFILPSIPIVIGLLFVLRQLSSGEQSFTFREALFGIEILISYPLFLWAWISLALLFSRARSDRAEPSIILIIGSLLGCLIAVFIGISVVFVLKSNTRNFEISDFLIGAIISFIPLISIGQIHNRKDSNHVSI
jgi:Zn-dependent protease with chaperone function